MKIKYIIILLCLCFADFIFASSPYFNVKDFGAVGDGKTLCTKEIQKAIDACKASGGGKVIFPAGTYLSSSLFLCSNIDIEILPGATVLFSNDIKNTPATDGSWEGIERKVYASLFTGHDLVNVTLSGGGTLDGQGAAWWEAFLETDKMRIAHNIHEREPDNPKGSPLKYPRPRVINLYNCNKVKISGITILNSPSWTVHPVYCENVIIDGITIIQPYTSPNTDGIDPESCKNVRITNCYISCGDDCITLKSGYNEHGRKKGIPCEDIVISNCTFAQGRSAIGIGSEMSGGVKNVTVNNCIFKGTLRGLRVKTGRGRGGVVENLLASNIIMEDVKEGISIDMNYTGEPDTLVPVTAETPFFKNIHYSNIIGRNIDHSISIIGLPEAPIEGLVFDNIQMDAKKSMVCKFANNPIFRNVVIQHSDNDSLQKNGNTIHLYKALGDAPASNEFEVNVCGEKAFVEKIGKFDIPIHYVQMTYDGTKPINIEVTIDNPIQSYTISPTSKQIQGNVESNKLTFSIDKPQYLIVKINDLENLFFLIDSPHDYKAQIKNQPVINILNYSVDTTGKTINTTQIQSAIDLASKEHGVLYFPKGVYCTGELNMKSNMTLLLDEGALICGSTSPKDYPDKSLIRMDRISNFSLVGKGTIDGSGWAGLRRNGAKECYILYVSNCNNINVDGVVLRDPTFWNTRVYRSTDVHLSNIKILNNRPYKNWTNTDGVDFDSSNKCSLINAVIHSGDDNLVVKGLDSTRTFNTEHILFDGILTLSNSAATKIGTETCVKQFNDIVFRNIDVVKCKRAMVISAFDSTQIKNIHFENINIESLDLNGGEDSRMIDFEITNNSWRECTGMCSIDGVTVKNINAHFNISKDDSQILGRTPEFNIKNITLQNININGIKIENLKEAGITTNSFANNIIISK